ncbi:carboxylating nicotinate-nucleotide diphosphorylase [Metabacillus niabensis]|uniref:nicotinate-nucleotide diphosphorylase (carboxylating) n=1 Tax=Metabacillus niabensis TaxID=324854 RepID=A0ABT9YXL8_9BACI|nr:carboxylating nicotinate-nucleotide diphosphorylase [Metabacillus niabensis]MDQ0224729.1 nicotinate-nucleotide pyrophosphorylase (carboxylating) [Metabacillus niabensis]PAD67007.1 nicotinate-nucleotide diphosphorylase (carboxylating) [Bacillus sp. 7586-K]
MNLIKLKKKMEDFFLEDLGEIDISSQMIFGNDSKGEAVIIAKENGILSGVDVIHTGYSLFSDEMKIELIKHDGEVVKHGDIIAKISGPIAAILSGERVILNLLQRMSGIATLTSQAVKTLNSDHTRICDTRKTSPGLRMFEKYAVRCGGGFNHRFGLYDGVMIKDNHIAFSGSIEKAVRQVKEKTGHMIKIEVEIETEAELYEAIEAGADVIMFDNRKPEEVEKFAKITPEHIITEASGGISLHNLAEYRNTKVDYISLGFLTHSYKSLDLSLNVK